MTALLVAIGAVAFLVLVFVAGLAWIFVRAVVWLVLLPFRLLAAAVVLPLLLLKFVMLGVFGVLAFALALGGVLAAFGVAVVVNAPLLPLAAVAALIWMLRPGSRRSAAVS
jgi:hypothetical protein